MSRDLGNSKKYGYGFPRYVSKSEGTLVVGL
jgi:hypothetical protein